MVARKKKKAAAPKSSGISLVGLLLIASLAGNVWQYANRPLGPKPAPDTVVVDDNKPAPPKPKPDAVNLKDCVLVTIVDKRTINEDPDYIMTMQDDAFWDEAVTKFADVEHMDAKDDPAKQWLAKANLSPPVVLMVNQKTKTVLWSMALPKGGTSEIRKKIGG